MHDESGLTLTELLVALAVMAMLAVVAMPRLGALVQGNRLEAMAGDAMSDVDFAISEATRRGQTVTVCPADRTGVTCDAGGSWKDDWMVFVDVNGNGALEKGDVLVRRRTAWGAGVTISARATNGGAQLKRLTLNPEGMFTGLPSGARLIFDYPDAFAEVVRCVRFSNFASEYMALGRGKRECP